MTDELDLTLPDHQAAILVVDDDKSVCDSMHEFLGHVGFAAHKATSAQQALSIIEEKTIQVVITDILMPGMDGLELTDMIKKNYDIDVIVMTGFSGEYSYEEAIGKGATDFVFKPIRYEELLLRIRRVLREREFRIEHNKMLTRLRRLATTDSLTKLLNSRSFFKNLEMEIDRNQRYHRPLALILIDIDFFKRFNDTFGHLEGDKVLARIGDMIRSCLRTMDSAYRYGGEEFTIILPETTGAEALTVAERILAVAEKEQYRPQKGHAIGVTVSLGVTEFIPEEPLTDLVRRADQAMYKAKKLGRNRIESIFPNSDTAIQASSSQ